MTITEATGAVRRKSFPKTLVLGRWIFGEEALERDLPAGQGGQAGCRPPDAGQRAVCRTRSDPASVGGGDGLDFGPAADDRLGELEATAGAAIDDMEEARTLTLPRERRGFFKLPPPFGGRAGEGAAISAAIASARSRVAVGLPTWSATRRMGPHR